MKKILKNSIYAIFIITYLIILSFAYTRMSIDRLSEDIKVFSGMFLVLGLLSLEKAYKNDNGKIAIIGIELLVMAFYSLSITHMIALLKCEFTPYVLISAGVVSIYYIFKIIVLYTKQRKKDLEKLSDISEIVKKDEPVKKEAKKTRERQEEIKTKLKEKEEKNKEKAGVKEKSKKSKKGSKTKKTTTKKENVKKENIKTEKTNSKEKTKNSEKTKKVKENTKANAKTASKKDTKKQDQKLNNETSKKKTKKANTDKSNKKEVSKND